MEEYDKTISINVVKKNKRGKFSMRKSLEPYTTMVFKKLALLVLKTVVSFVLEKLLDKLARNLF